MTTRRYCSDKEIDVLISTLVSRGWSWEGGRNHNKVISPTGRFVVYSKSPSDRRAILNIQRDVRHITNERSIHA